MNKNIYIYTSILFILIMYICIHNKNFVYRKNKNIEGGIISNDFNFDFDDISMDIEEEDQSKKNKNILKVPIMKKIKTIDQNFNQISHISEFLTSSFNYNTFEIAFTINRENKMITELTGGVLTIGSTSKNFHNFFVYLKKSELIIGLIGYNTHVSINLNKIKTSTMIEFRLIYLNPYINVYVNATDSDNKSINGYIDYLGNINEKPNKNFRLHLYPMKNSWCSIGTVNFIKFNIEESGNVNVLSGILNQESTSINNIKLLHTPRKINDIIEDNSINFDTKYFNNLELDAKNIIIMKLKLNNVNKNSNGSLIKMITKNKNYLELVKENSNVRLNLHYNNDKRKKVLFDFEYNDNINNIYIEIIPFIDNHFFCIYIENNLYKYTINLDLLLDKKPKKQGSSDFDMGDISDTNKKNKNKNILFTDITINNNKEFKTVSKNIDTNETISVNTVSGEKLADTFKLDTEIFNHDKGSSTIKLKPKIKKETDYSLLLDFKKNIKLEYLKLLKTNSLYYKILVLNNLNKWQTINNIKITKANSKIFTQKNLLINNNSIGSKFKLEVYTNKYKLQPLNILDENNSIDVSLEDNPSNLSYDGFGKTANIDGGSNILWRFLYSGKNEYRIYIRYINDGRKKIQYLYPGRQLYNVEKKPDSDDLYFISLGEKENKKYLSIKKNTDDSTEIQLLKNNTNCEFKRIPHNSITLNENITDLIELYGIENPYPKLYINNNKITDSTAPCSSIHSLNDNKLIENDINIVTKIKDKTRPYTMEEIQNATSKNKGEPKKIEANVYDFSQKRNPTNMIYNFCSNDINNYSNKLYTYDFKKNPLYRVDDNNNRLYKRKNRILLKTLSKSEQKLFNIIENLKNGANIIGFKNGRNLNNTLKFTSLNNIWTTKNQSFNIEWNEELGFNSPCGINIKLKDDNYLKDLRIYDNVFENRDLSKIIKSIKSNILLYLKQDLTNNQKKFNPKNSKFLLFSSNFNSIEDDGYADEVNTNQIKSNKDPCKKKKLTKEEKKEKAKKDALAAKRAALAFKSIKKDINTRVEKMTNKTNINKWVQARRFLEQYGGVNEDLDDIETFMKGGIGCDKITEVNNEYEIHTRDEKRYISNLIEKMLDSKNNELSRNSNENSPKSLEDIYKLLAIPLIEYEQSKKNMSEKIWSLEWDDVYEPEKTEFYLFHRVRQKYLINKNDLLEWSDEKIYNCGWKIIPNKKGKARPPRSEGELAKLCEKENVAEGMCTEEELYNKKIRNTVLNEIKNISINDIRLNLIKFNNKTAEYLKIYEEEYHNYLELIRIKKLRTITTDGVHLFSPNRNKYGEYMKVIQPDRDSKSPMINENQAYLIHLNEWTTSSYDSNIFIKVWDTTSAGKKTEEGCDEHIQNGSNIVIAKKTTYGMLYLKNTGGWNTGEKQVWTPTWSNSIKWTIEWDGQLHLDLNDADVKSLDETTKFIKKTYVPLVNRSVTIQVGNKITAISDKINWNNNVYEAIKYALDNGYIACRDYAWITYKNGKTVFYDDNYCNYIPKSSRNTLTHGWYVLHKNPKITKLYLDYNKIKYEWDHAVKFKMKSRCKNSYRKRIPVYGRICRSRRRKYCRWKVWGIKYYKNGPRVCTEYYDDSWNPRKVGLDDWIHSLTIWRNILLSKKINSISSFGGKNMTLSPLKNDIKTNSDSNGFLKGGAKVSSPSSQWRTRENNFVRELSNYQKCTSNIVEPIHVYFKSNTNYKYLRSDVKNKMLFTDEKKDFISGWYLLQKNGFSKWVDLYDLNISSMEG